MAITNKLLIILCAAFLLSTQCFAQETVDKTQARLVDEFGNVLPTSAVARLDRLATELQNEPSAKGFIINYRFRTEPAGKTIRVLYAEKNYLIKFRGINAEKVITVDGGETDVSMTQLWVVPVGATPEIRRDAYKRVFDDVRFPRKYDEYFFSFYDGCENDYGFCNTASLETFVTLVKKEKATAYIILYPELNEVRAKEFMNQSLKNDLTKKYKLPLSKLKIVNGGFRRQRSVELWILPKGEHAPVATPNAFPKVRRKARKRI